MAQPAFLMQQAEAGMVHRQLVERGQGGIDLTQKSQAGSPDQQKIAVLRKPRQKISGISGGVGMIAGTLAGAEPFQRFA